MFIRFWNPYDGLSPSTHPESGIAFLSCGKEIFWALSTRIVCTQALNFPSVPSCKWELCSSFVEVYPQLAYKFIEQTLQPGSSVSLKCSASGNPTPRISWTLDGFALPHNERYVSHLHITVSSVLCFRRCILVSCFLKRNSTNLFFLRRMLS